MHQLGRLIKRRMDELDLSFSEVGERGGISRATVHSLTVGDSLKGLPRLSTLQGLAAGLGVSLGVVKQAAAEAAGVDTGADPEYLARGGRPGLTDATEEELLAELARRAAARNPDRRK